ncbi:MAG: zinc-binding dehydrogenase [Cyanobacteria bacterium P01_F01_bin.86]
MKALVLEERRVLRVAEWEEPIATDGYSIIDVAVAGIGGSEYLGFNNPGIRALPSIMGHGITGVSPNGKRVAVFPLSGCNHCEYCHTNQTQLCESWHLIGVQSSGGFAEKVLVPNEAIVELPDNLTWEQSSFIEPFANAVNAWEISEANQTHTVAIIGAGGLGLGLTACARRAGCLTIAVVELSAPRRLAAEYLGANQSDAQQLGEFDIVFDTVGSEETRKTAVEMCRKGGKCVFLGFASALSEFNMAAIIRHQKKLMGSFVYTKAQFEQAIDLAQACDSSWVTNVRFEAVEDHLLRFLDNDFRTVKVALRPSW